MNLIYKNIDFVKIKLRLFIVAFLLFNSVAYAQTREAITQAKDPVIENIISEAVNNSKLEDLAYELLDGIGPRLVGTPQMQKAHDWAINKYNSWGIPARNEQWGEWRGWERGITHIDMVYPRIKSLEGTQLAWSPSTSSKGVTAEVIMI